MLIKAMMTSWLVRREGKLISIQSISFRLLTAKSWSAKGASHQPAFMGNCLTFSYMYLPCPPTSTRWVSPCILCPLMIGIMVVLLTFFDYGEYCFSTVRVVVTLGNACRIQGQNYAVLLQGSDVTGFHYNDWILGIWYFRLKARWLANHCLNSAVQDYFPEGDDIDLLCKQIAHD